MHLGILRLYCGTSGQRGYYNIQELGLAKAFAKNGLKVTFILLDSNTKAVREEEYCHHVTILTVPATAIGCHGIFQCSVLKERGIEVLQIEGDNQIFLGKVYKYCSKNKIFCYFYTGTLQSDTGNFMKNAFFRVMLRRNIAIYKQSTMFVKTKSLLDLSNKYGIKNAILAPVGLDSRGISEVPYSRPEAKKLLGFPADKKIVLFVGRLEKYKRPLDFLHIVKSLQKNNAYKFVMIGNGSLKKKLLGAIRDNGLAGDLTYLEKVDNEKIQCYYRACDYYINLNPNEIFGMAILEAMSQGAIVIAAHAPGPDMIIENHVSGFLVTDMVQTIDYLHQNAQLNEDIIRQRAESFKWDKTAKIMLKSLKYLDTNM